MNNKSGTTMTEVIAAFALSGIFLISASFVLTRGMKLYFHMQSAVRAVSISDLILDKITSEISAADIPAKGEMSGYYFLLDPEGRWIAFRSRNGSPAAIFADYGTEGKEGGGQLIVRFYGTEDSGAGNAGAGNARAGNTGRAQAGIDWKYDSSVYMGYQITELLFTRPDPEGHPDVLRIDLTMQNSGTGHTYHTFCFAENYDSGGADNIHVQEGSQGGLAGLPGNFAEFAVGP